MHAVDGEYHHQRPWQQVTAAKAKAKALTTPGRRQQCGDKYGAWQLGGRGTGPAAPARPRHQQAEHGGGHDASPPDPPHPLPPYHRARRCASRCRCGRHLNHGAHVPARKEDKARCHPWASGQQLCCVRSSFACGCCCRHAGGEREHLPGNCGMHLQALHKQRDPCRCHASVLVVCRGGADDAGATTTTAAGVAAVNDAAPQTTTVAADGGPRPHPHRAMTARRGRGDTGWHRRR